MLLVVYDVSVKSKAPVVHQSRGFAGPVFENAHRGSGGTGEKI
jgi:hypothetical protein